MAVNDYLKLGSKENSTQSIQRKEKSFLENVNQLKLCYSKSFRIKYIYQEEKSVLTLLERNYIFATNSLYLCNKMSFAPRFKLRFSNSSSK